jgi:hypothetical protein
VYSVEFSALELWGTADDTGDWIGVDLWESYLEQA